MENVEFLANANVETANETVLERLMKSAENEGEFAANFNKNKVVSSFIVENKDHVSKLLLKFFGIPLSMYDLWTIYDYIEDIENNVKLVLVHYIHSNNYFDPNNPEHEILKPIRGIIFDLNKDTMVANTQGYVDEITIDEPITVTDLNYEKHININNVAYIDGKLFMGYDSVFAKIFKHAGKVYFSTVRKIDAIKSKWGYSKFFKDTFDELSGFKIDDLFGEEKYSPFCHYFIINDTDLSFSSSLNDKKLFYIGIGTMWSPGEYDNNGIIPKIPNIKSMMNPKTALIQREIDFNIANKALFPNEFADIKSSYVNHDLDINIPLEPNQIFLKYYHDFITDVYVNPEYPFTKDDRLKGGEFVILTVNEKILERNIVKFFKIKSKAYTYRNMLLGDDPEPYHRFYQVLIDIYRKVEFLTDTPDIEVEVDNVNTFIFSGFSFHPIDRDTQFLILKWNKLFMDAISPAWKEYASSFIQRFNRNIINVAFFISEEVPKILTKIKREKFDVNKIIDLKTFQRMTSAYDYNRVRRGKERIESIHNFLLYTLNKTVLYKMINEVNKLIKFNLFVPPVIKA